MTWRRSLLSGAVATVVLAGAVFGGGLGLAWFLSGGNAGADIGSAEIEAWTDHALAAVLRRVDPREEANDWHPVRVETCGESAIAFYRDRGPEAADHYVWAMGKPVPPFGAPVGGRADSVDAEEVARLRARLPPCQFETDAATDDVIAQVGADARVLWMSVDGGGQVERGGGRVVGVTTMPMAPHEDPFVESPSRSYYVLLDRRLGEVVNVERVTMSISDDGSMAVGSDLEGAIDRPAAPPANQVYADMSFPTVMLFGWIDSPAVRAVDILVRGDRLRYTVGEPGFVIGLDSLDLDVASAGDVEFRLLGPVGIVLASGSVRDWQEQDVVVAMRCSDWGRLEAAAQLDAAEQLVDRILQDVRVIEGLPEDASREEIIAAARSTIDKGCQASAAARPLSEVVRVWYEQ